MNLQEKLKVAVVGVGKMGTLHLAKYISNPNVELVGFFDRNPKKANIVAEEFGVKSFDNLQDLFFGADAVSICTSTCAHFEIAKYALQMGLHILVEKPLTETLPQSEELVKMAKSRNLVLQVGYLERFRFNELKSKQEISRIKWMDCERLNAAPGRDLTNGVVLDLMVHDLNLVLSLEESNPRKVFAREFRIQYQSSDAASVKIEFESGVVASFRASRISPFVSRKMSIWNSDENLVFDFMGNEVHSKNRYKLEKIDPLFLQSQNFINSALGKERPLVDGEDALRTQRVADMIGIALEESLSDSVKERPANA